ncbi:ubiquitin-associated and SH3 domain-containing protein B [Aplysia californica]|uniref:Ubiquitin-associated and SH3 domain-containing protein B n=1 Tax=Aplysia californica TaxID=6500 RepID=A0ABM0JSS3_APLCA|nr:ubiquitin-associated and SH3 domain-containing protein B [Aplysia californica]
MAEKHRSPQKESETKTENGDIGRRLFVMRHGERCDFAFGRSWVNRCFDDKGNYTQSDLNLPPAMVPRASHKQFLKDSPLTEIGRFQARSTGDALQRAGVDIQHIYVSPSLRCVQTAQHVIEGMGNNATMCIEPTAFEWFGWYKNAMPNWLSPKHLADCGFNINVQHKPFVSVDDLHLDETVTDYYERCHKLAQKVLKKHEAEGGDILIVAHAGSLDTFTRRLLGKSPRNSQEMHQILSSFTYCSFCCCVENSKTGKWALGQPPIPPLHEFNWKVLL